MCRIDRSAVNRDASWDCVDSENVKVDGCLFVSDFGFFFFF